MTLSSFHFSGVYKFEVAPRILENRGTPSVK